VLLDDARTDDKLDALSAVVFDRTGRAVAETQLKLTREGDALVGEGVVAIDARMLGGSARLVISPPIPLEGEKRPPRRGALEKRLQAWTEPIRLDPESRGVSVRIPGRVG
jgi:hypothetical protein